MIFNDLTERFDKIIRGYDIRGVYGAALKLDLIEIIAEIFGNEWNGKRIVLGRDNRPHSKEISDTLIGRLKFFNVEIFDCGVTTSPVVSITSKNLYAYGIMITASHNHISYNGIKINKPDMQSYSGLEIKNIVNKFIGNIDNKFIPKRCTVSEIVEFDANSLYTNFLLNKFKINSSKRVAWNFMNASVNSFVNKLLASLQTENFIINNNLLNLKDNPDPMFIENIDEMSDFAVKNRCDLGFAFDGDCDRVIVFDNNGKNVSTEHIMMFVAKKLNFFGESIICDVKSSQKLKQFLKNIGCETIVSQIGHSIMKKKICETSSIMSGEISGHYIFRDLGCDDGLYMAMVLLQILQDSTIDFAQEIDLLPKLYCSENIKIYMSRKEVNILIDNIFRYAKDNAILFDITDGVKVLNDKGWVLFRGSNTEDCLTIRFEAFEERDYSNVEKWKDFLLKV
jgi:phosphomannomutase